MEEEFSHTVMHNVNIFDDVGGGDGGAQEEEEETDAVVAGGSDEAARCVFLPAFFLRVLCGGAFGVGRSFVAFSRF